MKEIWFAIGVCTDPAIGADSVHIKFFNSRFEAAIRMDDYICLYGTAYMGKIPEENLK